ncbi:lymphokine-activated killer T-cell-originated protein kinase [Musca vetustissima]|uniref:lymphokine-activated killer T-cell-originated protein kinase n=1 Tax=Musca vetustissima TaxID=27455 RepID=UPI002AB73D12|nr:lymphokine-activated killer T-cell-originated protein kinase [Musca vetustissima]
METPRKPLRNLHLEVNTPLQVPASPLMKTLGYGTGVNVYFLERSPKPSGQIRSPWAIKRVSQRTRRTNGENSKIFNDRIRKEAEILRKLKHPNIVGFRAIAKKDNDEVDSLALECCSTSLGSILEERLEEDAGPLPAKDIRKMLTDISSALNYLHTEAMLLHGDLKSHNILVKGEFEICKLCDFGVSLPLNKEGKIDFKENPELRYVGTELWCAPEIIEDEEVIDSKADIFSLGLIIYETIALIPPHSQRLDDTEKDEDEENSLEQSDLEPLDATMPYGTRPPLPQAFELHEDYNVIMELFYLCTNEDPKHRPCAKIIYDSLTIKS